MPDLSPTVSREKILNRIYGYKSKQFSLDAYLASLLMSIHKGFFLGYSVAVEEHIPANLFMPSGRFAHSFPGKMYIAVRLLCTVCPAGLYIPSGG